jgi:hypothetical protein
MPSFSLRDCCFFQQGAVLFARRATLRAPPARVVSPRSTFFAWRLLFFSATHGAFGSANGARSPVRRDLNAAIGVLPVTFGSEAWA